MFCSVDVAVAVLTAEMGEFVLILWVIGCCKVKTGWEGGGWKAEAVIDGPCQVFGLLYDVSLVFVLLCI